MPEFMDTLLEMNERHAQELAASISPTDYAERLRETRGDKWADYMRKMMNQDGWQAMAWKQAKTRPGIITAKPLYFPEARSVSHLFEFAALDIDCPPDFYSMSSTRSAAFTLAGHYEVKRRYVTMHPGQRAVRGHGGGYFFHGRVKPHKDVLAAFSFVLGDKKRRGGYFEAIDRDDGILVTVNYGDFIGSYYVAMLDKGETIASLYDQDTLDMIARRNEAANAAWGFIQADDSGKERANWSAYTEESAPFRDSIEYTASATARKAGAIGQFYRVPLRFWVSKYVKAEDMPAETIAAYSAAGYETNNVYDIKPTGERS